MPHLRPLPAAFLTACLPRIQSSDAVHLAPVRPVDCEFIAQATHRPTRSVGNGGSPWNYPEHRTERTLALLLLLVVSSFELSGCNPARTCDPLHGKRFSARPPETLADQCAQCLSEQAMTTPGQIRKSTATEKSAILHDMTVQEGLGESHTPFFAAYDGGSGPRNDPRYLIGIGTESSPQPKPIAWPIPESVLFLYAEPPTGPSPETQGVLRRIATGFILSVPGRGGKTSKYLVTARHVVDPEWALCGKRNPQTITVRLNRWGGGVAYESIPLNKENVRLFMTAADDVTDLALLPINAGTMPNLDRYKLVATEFDNLPTEDELRDLQREPRIVTVGVSAPKLTGLVDSPISESGVIKTDVSGSPMGVRCTVGSPIKALRMWLVDTSVEREVSGAPVYAALARGPSHSTTPVLVGIQAVVWPDRGQAGVTPVYALRDLVQIARARSQVAMDFRKGRPD